MNFGVEAGGDVHGPPHIFCLLFKKMEKVQRHDLTKIKFYIILMLHFFSKMNS